MIINTDLLKTRKSGQFIAIYGTQENPFSTNYDFLYKDEAEKTATALRKIAEDINAEADGLADLASSLDRPNIAGEPRAKRVGSDGSGSTASL